jgi:hypothetical protein
MFKYLMALFIFGVNCASINHKSNYAETIKITTDFDFFMVSSGELVNIKDSFKIIYYNDFIVYEIPITQSLSKVTFKENVQHEELLSTKIENKYFVYKPGQKSGFKFDSLTAVASAKFSVDSLLQNKSFQSTNFFNSSNDSLLETISRDNFLIEKYIPKVKFDNSYGDTSIYYFDSKLGNIDFSFSKLLDHTKQMKLFKIEYLYNESLDLKIPARKLMFKIEKSKSLTNEDLKDLTQKIKF